MSCAVGHRIGLLEAFARKRGSSSGMRVTQLAGERAAHLHGRRPMGVGEHRVLEAEPVERAEDVGAELDAGADLAELGRLFEHPHRETLARASAYAAAKPADAAARDQNRQA